MFKPHGLISQKSSRGERSAGVCCSAALVYLFLLILSLGSLNQAEAAPNEAHLAEGKMPQGWKSYHGNFFDIGVPPNFVARPEDKRRRRELGDGVSLWNRRLQVEFYVFSPQWNGVGSYTATRKSETLDSHESMTTGGMVEERWVMTAKNYVRFVVSITDTKLNTNKTFGIRIPNMRTYELVKPTFVQWRRTLQQFAD